MSSFHKFSCISDLFKKLFSLEPDYNKRVFGLDIMRSIAILTIMLGHGIMLEKAETNFPWIKLIDGVELFFVLSGFLIGGILLKKFNEPEVFGLKEIWHFWKRRWLRTLPNYYFILILNIILVYSGFVKEDFSRFNWKFFVFLHNFYTGFTGFFWESWSLSIEEWFYIFFPVLLGLISLIFVRQNNQRKKWVFLATIILFLVIPILLRINVASTVANDSFWILTNIYKVVIYRLDSIAFGLLGAFISFYYPSVWRHNVNLYFILGIVISYFVLYFKWPADSLYIKVFKLNVQSLGCFLLLVKFDSIKRGPLLWVRIITHISLISYSIYLINLGIVAESIRDHFPVSGPYSAWAAYGLYWIIVLALSTLLYKYFEKPIMDMRGKA